MSQKFISQAGVIPFRRKANGIEVCLITSTSGHRWGFPKGIIDGADTPQDTALKEALEEAGLRGSINREPLGSYHYEKWNSQLEVTVFLMEVNSCDDQWAESDVRERAWLPANEALARLDRQHLRQLLSQAIQELE